ncbi:hypothetical protein BDD43_5268 [Mucilaginibacter gracilis]|uniref:Uncharacterized protein n=1 Tax=Mucilaginibacter gracilis TaxID=423350 RepID=A0A495J9F5_9SPHI|nr:hypothetical protein [Mucilaginibacter gracilis]RKR85012.1 hypothetical protein BDD43_5268 [Mucilaginibacter gracilis]
MHQKPIQQTSILSTYILSVVNSVLPGILGIQILLVLLAVTTGDKRFNQ